MDAVSKAGLGPLWSPNRFRVFQGLGLGVQDSGFRVEGSGFRVQGLGFRLYGLGFRV